MERTYGGLMMVLMRNEGRWGLARNKEDCWGLGVGLAKTGEG